MEIKYNNIEFTSFSDGVCNIYSEDEEGNKEYKYISLGLENRILGYNRRFAAKTVNVEVNNVIRIPNVPGVDNYDLVEINNIGIFRIEMMQPIYKSNPLSIDLTLKRLKSWYK